MVGRIRNLSKNPIFNGLFIVTSGSILTTFLSYYYNFQTQSLFPGFAEFGDYVFIITLLTISQIIPASVSGTLNLIVTELKVKNEYAKLTLLYIKMLVLFSLVGFVLGFFVFSISNLISDIFQVKNVYYIQLLGLLIFLSTASIPHSSFLYGLLKFKSSSFLGVFGSILKIVLLVYFYNLGFGFVSILYSFIFAITVNFILGNLLLVTHFDKNYKLNDVSLYTKKLIMFSLPLFFILTGTSILNQLDIIFLKTRLTTELSGMYGYLNNFGKIFYFGSFLFIGAMAPQITESYNKKENYFKIFWFYFKIVFSIVSLGLITLVFFAKEFLDMFIYFSAYIGLRQSSLLNFYSILEYIPLYSVFISVYVFVNFLVIFLIAVSAFRIYVAFISAVLLQGLLIFVFANDIYTAIYCNLLVSSLLLAYLIYEIYKKYTSFNNSSNL